MSDTLKASLWMIGAIVSFTSMAVAGRALGGELDTFEIMLFRSLIGMVIVTTAVALTGRFSELRTARPGIHFLRNVSHFTGQNLWFFSVTVIPLAQVFAIEFTSPLWVMFLAPLVLSERLTRVQILTGLVGFIGILIVARPFTGTIEFGLVTVALAAIAFAASALFTRELTRTESITCILFYLVSMQAGLGLVTAGIDGDIALPSLTAWPWVVLVAVAGLVAHFCLTTALSLAPATIVMPIDFARLPVVAIVGALVYSEALDPYVFLGAVLIFSANYYNIWHATRRRA